jgi:hypothetical protein
MMDFKKFGFAVVAASAFSLIACENSTSASSDAEEQQTLSSASVPESAAGEVDLFSGDGVGTIPASSESTGDAVATSSDAVVPESSSSVVGGADAGNTGNTGDVGGQGGFGGGDMGGFGGGDMGGFGGGDMGGFGGGDMGGFNMGDMGGFNMGDMGGFGGM